MRTLKKEFKELKNQISRDCTILYHNEDTYNKNLNCKVHYGDIQESHKNFTLDKTFCILCRKINNNRYMYLTFNCN